MDLQTIRWNLSKKDHLDCVKSTLVAIKSNYSKYSHQDLVHLTYEFILFKEFKKEQSKWVKKTNNMEDLQCVDTLINYFETETDLRVRQLVFDLIFSDVIYNSNDLVFKNNFATIFISYAISVQSKQTLDCLTKWIETNIVTNEDLLMNNFFNFIINDHFSLQNNSNLDSLAQTSPQFTSIFLIITLNSIAKRSFKLKHQTIANLLGALNSCLKLDHQLLMLVYKHNISSGILNPFPGILYLTVIYPLELFNDNTINSECDKNKVYELIETLHLNNLKQIQDFNTDKMKMPVKTDDIKILNLNHVFFIEAFFSNYLKSNENNLNVGLFSESLDRLAQILQLCNVKQVLQFNKIDIKNVFEKFANIVNNELFKLLF